MEKNKNKIKEHKMYADWEGRNKTVLVHRWHYCLCRKLERIKQKILEVISDYSKAAGHMVIIF